MAGNQRKEGGIALCQGTENKGEKRPKTVFECIQKTKRCTRRGRPLGSGKEEVQTIEAWHDTPTLLTIYKVTYPH